MRILFISLFLFSLLGGVAGLAVYFQNPLHGAALLIPSSIYAGTFTIAYVADDKRNAKKRD